MNVFVGMSGGVDSSLTAALLKEQGYDVTGVYMKNWSQDLPGMKCPWKEDYEDAQRVAVQLDIPFKVYDFQKEYRHRVVDYMIDGYRRGLTPNPDIMCNQEVKFKLFLEASLADGADMIATGHYARILTDAGAGSAGVSSLHVAANPEKDQTYFLYRVTETALSRSLMPIGEYETKAAVRVEAEKRGLSTAHKKDSQGICFIGKVGIKDFLLHELGEQPHGAIIDQHGVRVGEHDGAIFYTIGQRQGLGVGGGLPYYVTGKDMATNEVYVTTDLQDSSLWRNKLDLAQTHWIHNPPELGKTYAVRTRYRAEPVPATFRQSGAVDGGELLLEQPVRASTPGQSAVLYDGDTVLGGGIVV
ncbi:tRNA 2-thiouridine(34) synthase MnmA [Candidatus Saccharibacteria bacterium]|nr:MAG: tRNA 2-thiouridine(34) synthase MnmA [Candidatus Saccharibacteria bacterium]